MTYSEKIGSDRIDLTEVASLDDPQIFTGVKTFEGSSDVDHVIYTAVTGEAQKRAIVHGDGSLEWGDGTNPQDLKLERAFTSGMRITGDQLQLFNRAGSPGTFQGITVRPAISTSPVFAVSVAGDGANRFRFDATGDLNWGDGTAEDTRLARVGVGQLQTFGDFGISGVLQAYAGVVHRTTVQIANFAPNPVSDHTMLLDPPPGGMTATITGAHATGSTMFFKDKGGNASVDQITITSADGDLIDGAPTFTIDQDFGAIELRSDGTNWWVVSSHKM